MSPCADNEKEAGVLTYLEEFIVVDVLVSVQICLF